jgi:hypothetical protein
MVAKVVGMVLTLLRVGPIILLIMLCIRIGGALAIVMRLVWSPGLSTSTSTPEGVCGDVSEGAALRGYVSLPLCIT